MSNTQFGCLIAPQLLMLLVAIGLWLKRIIQDWSSKLKYDCTRNDHDLQVRMESLQHGQERLLSRLDSLQSRR